MPQARPEAKCGARRACPTPWRLAMFWLPRTKRRETTCALQPGVAELVDARGLKPRGLYRPCRFESGRPDQATETSIEMDINNWIGLGGVIIAIIALLRPEITEKYRSYKSKLVFHPASKIEIGYSEHGPTIGIYGTFFATHQPIIIEKINIQISRERDKATYKFRWLAFRSLKPYSQQINEIEVASAFIVNPMVPEKRNIMLHDTETLENFKDQILEIRNLYSDFLTKLPDSDKILKDEIKFSMFQENHKENFIKAFASINNYFYWDQGIYNGQLYFRASGTQNKFAHEFKFSISEEESKRLRLNTISIIKSSCFLNTYYNFTNSELIEFTGK